MDERKTSRSRRRASRMMAEKRRKGPPVSCDDESPTRERAKPPRRKKKEPLFEEDIIEGFAIMSFLKFEDIERWKTMAKSNVRDEERTTAAGALGLPSRSVGAKTNPQQVPQLTQGSTIYTWPSHLEVYPL
ncbi:unnamed protein product [Nesidiocoris tenuis]|uniref:Uncharacterized protein n=1 Tax=Nesidiocoris tenuis TaxID=355587 RepID=A0A6H5G8G5_9HEMI|nr:unnamed protein product [Nesidiocoris tenuis]